MTHNAYIALGANLGPREQHIARALERLRANPDVVVVRVSDLIETLPVGGPPGQPHFLNGAAHLLTPLSPRALLSTLLEIERECGRRRPEPERNSPRTLDLDLLLYDDLILEQPDLQLPHPRMHEREFVLRPLAQIAGGVVHPKFHRSINELLEPGTPQQIYKA